MKSKNDILNDKLYIATIYIMNFFITNFWFLIMTSPIAVYILKFGKSISISPLLLISIIIGPAITTLFSVMGKLVREGDISPTKDFFHFYKLNFFQGLLVGTLFNISISIVYVDMNYFSLNGNTNLSYIFLLLLIFILMLGFYIYPIISRYNIKIRHLFRLSIKLLFKKIYISLSSISIIIILFWGFKITKLSLVALLFGASIICYLITKIQKKMIDELEIEIKEKYL